MSILGLIKKYGKLKILKIHFPFSWLEDINPNSTYTF
jgi:hypothetical protein